MHVRCCLSLPRACLWLLLHQQKKKCKVFKDPKVLHRLPLLPLQLHLLSLSLYLAHLAPPPWPSCWSSNTSACACLRAFALVAPLAWKGLSPDTCLALSLTNPGLCSKVASLILHLN